jgi:hypothetical protein
MANTLLSVAIELLDQSKETFPRNGLTALPPGYLD